MPRSKINQKIPNKLVFDLWVELGTMYKVANHFATNGILNRYTGKPLSPTSWWERAMRWVLDHPAEAKVIYEEKLGEELDQETWERWLVKKARKVFDDSPWQYKQWIKKHGYERYKDIWGTRFNTLNRR